MDGVIQTVKYSVRRIPSLLLAALLLINLLSTTAATALAASARTVQAAETATAGTTIALTATGFAPGEALTTLARTPYGQTLSLHSLGGDPAILVVGGAGAAVTANGSGASTLVFNTAENYQTGAWTITVRGQQSAREQATTVTLVAAATPVATFAATPAASTAPAAPRATAVVQEVTPTAAVTTPVPPATAAPATAVASTAPAATATVAPTTAVPSTAPATATSSGAPTMSTAPSAAPATSTAVPSASPSAAPSVNPQPSVSASPAPSVSTSPTPSAGPAPSAGPVPSASTSPTPSASASPAPSASPSASASPTPTTLPSPSPSPSAGASVSPSPSSSPAPGVPAYSAPGTNPPTNSNPGVPPPAEGPALAPTQLLPIFERAASLTGVPKEILLAIARVESNFTPTAIGPYIPQLAGTENEHALGMMQFLPGTYRMVMPRVDAATGKNLGMQGIWDAESAIYAAAFYLQDSGAPGNIRKALYSYNNADWYVDLIISWANTYAGGVVADPTLLNNTSPNPSGSLTTPQNPLLPSNSRHIDMPSPIQLYAPWTAGETWHAGGEGSFYGDGFHTDAYGNYYTVDFNKGAWPNSQEDDGEPILAAADGIVNNIYQDSAGAWVVELYHVAPDGSQLRTLYVHLKTDPRLNPGIKVNQAVLHGTPIGLNGSTGESTGAHLHFGLWLLKGGQWVSIRAEPMDGRALTNGASITSTNRPVATDTTDQKLEFGFTPNSPSNADMVTIQAKGGATGLPVAKIEIYANTAQDGSIRGQWQPVGAFAGGSGQADWNAAPLAEGTYRLLLVQTDAAGNRAFHGLTDDTAVRYTIRRGEPRGSVVANPRADLALLAPLDGAALATLGGRNPVISGPLRFAQMPSATAVAPLGAAAAVAATGAPTSGKVRDAAGLLIEEATTNLLTNPSFERGAEGWSTNITPDSRFVVTPVESALFGKRSLRLDNSKGTVPAILATRVGDGTLATWSVYARAIAVEGAGTTVPPTTFGLGMAGLVAQGHDLGATWQRFSFTGTSGGGSTEGQVVVPPGAIVEIDGAQLEAKPYATSYADGSLGAGYGWAGVADASVSGRLPTGATLSLDGLVGTAQGAISFWLTPTGPLAEGATLFALGEHLTLAVAGTSAVLRWDSQTLATVPWQQGVTHQYALTWQGTALTFSQDGKVAGQSTLAAFILPAGTQLALGSTVTGSNVANVAVQDLAIWHGAPDADIFASLAGAGQFLRPGVTETITLDTGLTLAAQGLAPGGIRMQFSFDGVTWTEPEPFATSKTLALPTGAGEVRIYVRLTDEEGRAIVSTDRVQVVTPARPATEATDTGR